MEYSASHKVLRSDNRSDATPARNASLRIPSITVESNEQDSPAPRFARRPSIAGAGHRSISQSTRNLAFAPKVSENSVADDHASVQDLTAPLSGKSGGEPGGKAAQEPVALKSASLESSSRNSSRSASIDDEESQYEAPNPAALSRRASRSMSQSVGSQSIGNIRVVTETPSSVLAESRWALVALALNVSLIMAIIALQRTIVLPVDASLVQHYGGVTLEIVLLYSNVLTMKGLKHGASVIFDFVIQEKSVRAESFAYKSFEKAAAAYKLPSVVWVAVELLKLITPFCAIALYAESHGAFNDFSDCVYFVQDKRFIPVDRQWPTLAVEVGVAEYVFGTSLGIMRSEQTDEIKTTAIFPPALRSSLNDGDTIIGLGFTADISTECVCSTGVNASDIVTAGVDSAQVNEAMEKYHDLAGMTGITFGISAENQTLRISNILSGAAVCGGNVGARLLLPLVCSTTISNHRSAQVEVAFRTDGTSASITPDVVEMISDIGPADVDTWLLFAMTKILEGPVSAFPLPPQTPGSVSPLLWWTTPNLIAVDRAMVEAGIETMYAILFKAAIQRTYVAKATQCPRKNMLTSHMSTITIRKEGMICAMLILAVQVVVSAFSVAMFGLWLASPDPIGPAVRATREFVYFMALFSSSTLACNMCELGNGASYAIWQELDVVARIGEALHSLDMPVGQLVVDKPSMVRALKNGRKYM